MWRFLKSPEPKKDGIIKNSRALIPGKESKVGLIPVSSYELYNTPGLEVRWEADEDTEGHFELTFEKRLLPYVSENEPVWVVTTFIAKSYDPELSNGQVNEGLSAYMLMLAFINGIALLSEIEIYHVARTNNQSDKFYNGQVKIGTYNRVEGKLSGVPDWNQYKGIYLGIYQMEGLNLNPLIDEQGHEVIKKIASAINSQS